MFIDCSPASFCEPADWAFAIYEYRLAARRTEDAIQRLQLETPHTVLDVRTVAETEKFFNKAVNHGITRYGST